MSTYDEVQEHFKKERAEIERKHREFLYGPVKYKTSEKEREAGRKRYENKKKTEAVFGKQERTKKAKPVYVDPELEILETLKNGMKGTL